MLKNRFFNDNYNSFNQVAENNTAQNFKPRFTAQLPEAWFAKESITLITPDGQANIIASSEPLDGYIDAAYYAESQGEVLQYEFPYYRELSFEPAIVFENRRGYIRRFQWTPPDSYGVTQIQIYYVENERGYLATATTATNLFERYRTQLEKVLDGLRIE